MGLGLLDLNDCNLQLWHEDNRVQSPGYALLEGDQYVFGTSARAAARVQPRNVNTRFWWHLSTQALQPTLGPARHTGDLAHAHLEALYQEASQPDELVFAVSGSMQREQLSLLLGIAHQCPFEPVGLVNRSVVLGSLYAEGPQLWHLELQLHQSLLCRLARSPEGVELQENIALPGCGLLQLQERIVELIALAFVRQTRFDPRRKASSEQALYDALPQALRALQTSTETNLEVDGYRARIVRAELEDAGQKLVDSVRQSILGVSAPLIADPLAALLPGFRAALPNLHIAAADDVRRALESHRELVVQRATNLNYLTALPSLCESSAAAPHNLETSALQKAQTHAFSEQPTHILHAHQARPLQDNGTDLANGWEIYKDPVGWQLRGQQGTVRINDLPTAPGQALGSGDTIAIGTAQFTLISVLE